MTSQPVMLVSAATGESGVSAVLLAADSFGGARPLVAALLAAGLRWAGWLYVLPAMALYGALRVLCSLSRCRSSTALDWNGLTPATWVGLDNYVEVPHRPGATQCVVQLVQAHVLHYCVLSAPPWDCWQQP